MRVKMHELCYFMWKDYMSNVKSLSLDYNAQVYLFDETLKQK